MAVLEDKKGKHTGQMMGQWCRPQRQGHDPTP